MISKEILTIEWIKEVSKANRKADMILVEKAIRALLLLEGLASSGLSFIFKGGTALMLLMDSLRRLSIDIDIIISKEPENLDEILKSFAEVQGFTRVEMQHRATDLNIENVHYKFYYKPIHKTHAEEEAVLLDILFEANNYQKVSLHEIKSELVETTGKAVQVNIPSFEDLLGDKLTAFAPNTTGIPYYKKEISMSMEIIKQLYDIGCIFDRSEDVEVIKKTFNMIAKTEITYRGLKNAQPADVLEDIFQTSLCLSLRGMEEKEVFEQLQEGIRRVSRFIISEPYHLDTAISHAAKTAYLARLIATDQKTIEKFKDPKQIADAEILQPHNTRLNKLKKSNPEAFFYWWKATKLR
jgi:predicted nucleotidyltransferase component of viral defense system